MGEVNQFKWVGVRPVLPYEAIPIFQDIPEGAQKVWAYGWAENNRTIIYTIPTGKKLCLCTAILMLRVNADGYGNLHVRDTDDVAQYSIFIANRQTGNGASFSVTFPVPLEIEAGWTINVYSSAPSFYSYGFICGYLI